MHEEIFSGLELLCHTNIWCIHQLDLDTRGVQEGNGVWVKHAINILQL